ncbi:MAG: AEC family transporter [Enterocloster sp.]
MNAGIITKQMLVLFCMMAAGYWAFKKGLMSAEGTRCLSSLIVRIFSPALMIASVLNKEVTYPAGMVMENVFLVIFFFLFLIILSRLMVKLMRVKPEEESTYRLMMIFPNLGFMGIPLVSSLYGEEAVIFVSFYIMGYNLLIYSLGILMSRNPEADKTNIPWKKMCNVGTLGCIAAILIFVFRIRVPQPVENLVSSLGNTAVPLSMMTVGVMVAQSDLKTIVTDKKQILFTFIRLLLIPAVCIPILRLLLFDPVSKGIFLLLMAMPVGSMVLMIEKEYGGKDGRISAQGIALTSVVSVLTIPVITFLA